MKVKITHVDNELSVNSAGVNTNSPEARQQFHWNPAVGVHLTSEEEIVRQVLVAEVVLSDAAHSRYTVSQKTRHHTLVHVC